MAYRRLIEERSTLLNTGVYGMCDLLHLRVRYVWLASLACCGARNPGSLLWCAVYCDGRDRLVASAARLFDFFFFGLFVGFKLSCACSYADLHNCLLFPRFWLRVYLFWGDGGIAGGGSQLRMIESSLSLTSVFSQ